MSNPKPSGWADTFQRPESAPKAAVAAEDNPPDLNVRHTEKNGLARPVKKAVTYRLPADVLALIDAEIAAEAEQGNRLTKDDAVSRGLRAAYGKASRRKTR